MTASGYLEATNEWRTAYPGAVAAVLAMNGVSNPPHHPANDEARERLETELRTRYGALDRPSLRASHPIDAYDRYYHGFGQTYHVQHQLESVAIKNKPIPRRATLVEAMFMAELADQILTAGHDLAAVQLPVRVDIARPGDGLTMFSGATREPPLGDMIMRDSAGIISSVVLGPDNRTQITPATTSALFAVYAPPGIVEDTVRAHLEAIARNVRLVSPGAETLAMTVVTANGDSGTS